MGIRRRRRGFEPAGQLPAQELGLPRGRSRELVLSVMWRRAAGDAIAQRARTVGVSRGVLEIAVGDDRWLESLKTLLPRLAARLAQLCPELGIRKFRLRSGGSSGTERLPTLPLGEPPADRQNERSLAAKTIPEGETPPIGSQAERLEAAMERCLRRPGPR